MRSSVGALIPAPSTTLSPRSSRRVLSDQSGVGGQDLLLVLDDCFLIPQDLALVAEQENQALLVLNDPLLISDDYAIVGDNRLLIPERRLCHCQSLC